MIVMAQENEFRGARLVSCAGLADVVAGAIWRRCELTIYPRPSVEAGRALTFRPLG